MVECPFCEYTADTAESVAQHAFTSGDDAHKGVNYQKAMTHLNTPGEVPDPDTPEDDADTGEDAGPDTGGSETASSDGGLGLGGKPDLSPGDDVNGSEAESDGPDVVEEPDEPASPEEASDDGSGLVVLGLLGAGIMAAVAIFRSNQQQQQQADPGPDIV